MTYHVKVPAAEHGQPECKPQNPLVEGENQLLKAVKHIHTYQEVCASTHMRTH